MLRHTLIILFFCCRTVVFSQDFGDLERNYLKVAKKKQESKAGRLAIRIADGYLSLPQGQKNYKKTIEYYNLALKHGRNVGDLALQTTAYLKLGKHYGRYQETNNEAVHHYNKGIALAEKKQDWQVYVSSTSELSKIYGRNPATVGKSIGVLQRSLSAAQKYGIPISKNDYYKRFAGLYRKKGDERNAQIFLKRLGKKDRPLAQGQKVTTSGKEALSSLEFELEEARKREEELNGRIADLQSYSSKEGKEYQSQISFLEEQKELAESNKTALEQRIVEFQARKEAQEKANLLLKMLIGLALIVLFVAVVGFIGQRRANRRLAAKNREILQQKQEIEAQKYEIEKQSRKLRTAQEKSEKLLLNILPKATAEELKENGFAQPKHYDMVTVMFTDFKGFTGIAEQLTPVEIVRELDICFLKFDDIAERHNMEKIKTIGDAYMCAGGIPLANNSNPVDAVNAGLEMQAFVEQRKQEKISRGENPFELRLGIHTGPVVAGVVGKKKFAYDIWGDAVNIAARMESSSEVGRVNISEATYEHVKHFFYCNYRGKIKAKNKGHVDMYFVNGPIV